VKNQDLCRPFQSRPVDVALIFTGLCEFVPLEIDPAAAIKRICEQTITAAPEQENQSSVGLLRPPPLKVRDHVEKIACYCRGLTIPGPQVVRRASLSR
jgi:hypothetical protein